MTKPAGFADEKVSVAAVYENAAIADSYLDKRLKFAWQRLLHDKQVGAVSRAVAAHRPQNVLEVAPGPARLAPQIAGIARGTMVENSPAMVAIAVERLARHGLADRWNVLTGDAFALDRHVPGGTFDFAYTFRFIRHFRLPERTTLYAQLNNALTPGGILMFDVVGQRVREKLEAKTTERPADAISIYDATYTEESFKQEMAQHGFEVVQMLPVIRHFHVQAWLSYKCGDIAPRATSAAVDALEQFPSRHPLEWVATCRKV